MPGPIPDGNARRRNPPTIPTTSLPAKGRTGRPPKAPASYALGDAGRAWWKWAWSTPQAAAWDPGALYVIARRAQLEDELAAVHQVEALDLTALCGVSDFTEVIDRVNWIVGQLQARASGATSVMREMDALDDRLGLTPKAMAQLRWKIVDDSKPEPSAAPKPAAAKVRRLRAVDPAAAAG